MSRSACIKFYHIQKDSLPPMHPQNNPAWRLVSINVIVYDEKLSECHNAMAIYSTGEWLINDKISDISASVPMSKFPYWSYQPGEMFKHSDPSE